MARMTEPVLTEVTLRPITDDNLPAVLALDVTDVQHNYVADVAQSLADAEQYPEAMPWYRAVYAGDEPVGFVMISDNVPPGDPTLVGPYFLWRLLIDARHQGRGYGRATLERVLEYVRTRPGAEELLTSVSAGEEGSPMGFYLRLGFIDTGADHEGERVLRLPL
jgi:diamine N-acetyltransferase